jgi:lysozyme family protein
MKANADKAIRLMLAHEGGFVNHPRDPGGATNRGVTIGTLRSLGMDLDGDGDVDIADLKSLTEADAARVFKRFYWDAVQGDLLPSGVDYVVADFAVNSGPSRAAKHLQRAVGVTQDGNIGPQTLAAVRKADPIAVVQAVTDTRLRFLESLPTWGTFGKGWARRVDEVENQALAWASQAPRDYAPPAPKATEIPKPATWLARFLAWFGK